MEKVEGSQSKYAEVAGSEVTVHKIYAKKLFEEKVMNVEGSQSKGAEVIMKKNGTTLFEEKVVNVDGSRSEGAEMAGSEVTMDIKYEKKIFSEVNGETVRVGRCKNGRVL